MKKTLLTILITTILTALIVLSIFEIIAQQNQLEADVLVEIDSEILAEKRNILILLPRGYDPLMKYPVLYVLDGSSQDFRISRIAEVLNIAEVVPEMIIVGIPNSNRNRDLTPHYIFRETDGEIYGGGDQFLSFLTDEVAPYIEQNYPTNGYKMLAGHSRGGLFAFYAYMEDPVAFDAYFSFSPAFWRDGSIIVEKAETALTNRSDSTFMYLSLGTAENDKMKAAYVMMTDLLDRVNKESFVHQYIPEANHGNNLFYSTPIALRLWSDAYLNTKNVLSLEE
ncbi:alpha/beta hydrolase [Ekhidna sp. To15]|uniref:alpha/beta hydrolase n=1 Tax=Ekhidna sp. To15 TaxID=3395267 RepID=UPI003F5240B0